MKESQYRFRVWDDFWKGMHYFDFCTNIELNVKYPKRREKDEASTKPKTKA